MKKLIMMICLGMTLLLTANASAVWIGSYEDLTNREGYVPSTDIGLASSTCYTASNPGLDGGIGYQLSDEGFQLNLLYQAVGKKTISEMKADIEAFDDWRDSSLGNWNFPDSKQYFLRIEEGGGLPIGNYQTGSQEYQSDSGQTWVQWTISGWWDSTFHTILAGSIIGEDYLQIIGGYRSYQGDVNPVENFEGNKLLCEMVGYTFDLDELNLEVTLIPEPATIAFLVIGTVAFLRKKHNHKP